MDIDRSSSGSATVASWNDEPKGPETMPHGFFRFLQAGDYRRTSASRMLPLHCVIIDVYVNVNAT
jgi:hypothetical protein